MPKGIYKRGIVIRKPHSEETKKKIGLANSISLGGRKVSEESKRKNSESHKGEKAYNWKGGYENKLWNNGQRRIRKLGNGGFHTLEQWQDLKKKYNYMCLCCKRFEPEITLSEDHIIPLKLGGNDNIENVQPLCRSCNSRKSAKIISFIKLKSKD